MKRDIKGNLLKMIIPLKDINSNFGFVSFKISIFIILFILIFLLLSIIISRYKILEKIFLFFDDIMTQKEEGESQKKNGIFY